MQLLVLRIGLGSILSKGLPEDNILIVRGLFILGLPKRVFDWKGIVFLAAARRFLKHFLAWGARGVVGGILEGDEGRGDSDLDWP